MPDTFMQEVEELLGETFSGGRPGKGTQYLDHDSGIVNTLKSITAEQASQKHGSHPSIAGHVRHMIFHMRVACEWIAGDHSSRDWKGSFLPQEVTEEEWSALQKEIEETKEEYLRVIEALSPDQVISESGATGVIAHLAYHLGAIRQRSRKE
jgi:hypothetical protein